MTDLLERTGSYLGPQVFSNRGPASTRIHFGGLGDDSLAKALRRLDAAVAVDTAEIAASSGVPSELRVAAAKTFRTFSRPQPSDEVTEVLSAISELRDVTALTLGQVLASVGIRPRTYHAWKADGRLPRADSVGALWPALETIRRLRRDLGDHALRTLMRVEPQRQLFERGDYESLVRIIASQKLTAAEAIERQDSPSSAVGPETPWAPQRSSRRAVARPARRVIGTRG